MKYFTTNGWFDPKEFMRAAAAVHEAHPLKFMDEQLWDCKYIQLYVDQRTKSFIFRTGDGVMLTRDKVYALFPSLRDADEDVQSPVSAGVRPYPE